MKKKKEQLQFVIAEMSGGKDINVPIAKGIDIKALTEGDDNPMFVTVDALIEGKSKHGRYYDSKTIHSVAKQVNENRPDAYEGHLRDEDRAFKTPQAKTIWVGAKVYQIDGKSHLFIKGYVMPYAKSLKTYLRAAKATGKKVAVSIYGTAKTLFDNALNAKVVVDFNLESIDWARSGSEGINGLGYLTIAREMSDDEPENAKTVMEMFDEARSEIEEKVRKEIGSDVTVIKEMLGTEDVVETVREMAVELRNNKVDNILRQKVDNLQARKILRSIIVAEMRNDIYTEDVVKEMIDEVLTSDEGKLIIKSVRGREIAPKETGTLQSTRRFTKIIKN